MNKKKKQDDDYDDEEEKDEEGKSSLDLRKELLPKMSPQRT